MNPLTLTFSILALLAIATYARLEQAIDTRLVHTVMLGHAQANRALQNDLAEAIFTLKCAQRLTPQKSDDPQPRKPSDTTKTTPSAPRKKDLFPSHLNIACALLPTANYTYAKPYRDLLETLICQQYSDAPFYKPHLETEIVEKLIDLFSADTTIEQIEQLGSLDMGDDLQESWFYMLRGSENTYPSLLDTLTWQPQHLAKKINVATAPLPILLALFENQPLVDQLIKERTPILEDYQKNGTPTNETTLALTDLFASTLSPDLLEKYTDMLDYKPNAKPTNLTLHGTSQAGAPKKPNTPPTLTTLKLHRHKSVS